MKNREDVRPDSLWSLGALEYLVNECKSGATSAKAISKHDCNQLTGSMIWFGKQYDGTSAATPIMVHQKITSENAATLHPEARIITIEKLDKLKDKLRGYARAIDEANGFADVKVVAKQLTHFGLTAEAFVSQFTTKVNRVLCRRSIRIGDIPSSCAQVRPRPRCVMCWTGSATNGRR